MLKQQRKFAKIAAKILKDNNNKLPKRNECSDKRHAFKYQRTTSRTRARWCTKHKSSCKAKAWMRSKCHITCKTWIADTNRKVHKDATLAKFAVLNF